MRLSGIFFIILFYSFNVRAQSTIQPYQLSSREFTEVEILEDIQVLKSILAEAHPSLYLYNTTSEIDHSFDDFIRNIPTRQTERQLYRNMLELISKINCGHTWLNASKQLSDSLWQQIDQFPLDVKIIENKLIYAGNNSTASLNKGSEILEINGIPSKELIQTFLNYTVGDGFIETGRIRMIERRFGFYFALLYGFPSLYEITYLDDLQEVSKIELAAGLDFNITKVIRQADNANIQLSRIDSRTGILKIRSFSNWKAENKLFNFKTELKKAFREIGELNYENLIIDLRDNRGGSDAYGLELLSYLVSDSIRPFRTMYSKTIDSPLLRTYGNLDDEVYQGLPEITTKINDSTYVYCQQIWMLLLESNLPESTAGIACDEPFPMSKPNFNGNLYLLINGNTFSTATDVSSILFSQGLATFYGEETGGGYYVNTSGITTTVTLPNTKFELRLPLIRYETNVRNLFAKGRGVIPHYKYPETIKGIKSEDDEMLKYLIKTINK